MKLLTIILLLSLQLPCYANDEVIIDSASAPSITPIHSIILPSNHPFSIKHPKLHTFGRTLRKRIQTTASTLSPYFQIVGGIAQVITCLRL